MPTTPYAKLLLSINAGPPQDGGITASPGDTVQPSAESTAQWDLTTPPRWEIYAYPPGWTGPASGWVTESVPQPGGGTADVYIYLGLGPPPAFALPALPMWGKFLLRLTVQGGLLNGRASEQLVDNTTAVQTIGPNGLLDVAVGEEGQFDTARSWIGGWQEDLRLLDATLAGSASPYAALPTAITIGAGAIGGVNQYAQGDHAHPVPAPTVVSAVSAGTSSLGVSTVLAREDHAHQVTTGTPGTIHVGDLAYAGAAASLAKSDHQHALVAPTTITAVSAATGSLGSSTVVAREDHAHQVITDLPVNVGTSNQLGVNTALAKADHVHALSFATVNSILAGASAPITVNGQTITSGGFIAPYFSTSAANPSTTGLLRAANGTTIIAGRDAANSGDVDLIAWSIGNVLSHGSTSVAGQAFFVGNAGGFEFVTASGGPVATLSDTNLYFATSTGAFTINNEGPLSITAIGGTEPLNLNNQVRVQPEGVQFFTSASSFGSGVGVVVIQNATTEPTQPENNCALLWTWSGSLKSASKHGVLAVLAPQLDTSVAVEDLRAPDRRAARLTTTNATTTTAIAFTMPDNATGLFEARVIAWNASSAVAAGYVITQTVKRVSASAATLVGTAVRIVQEDNAGMDAEIDVITNDVRVRVTGLDANTIQWFVTLDVQLMQPA